MRFVFFDGIQEPEVSASLARRLRDLGHEVWNTGRLGKGEQPKLYWQDSLAIGRALAVVMQSPPDVLLNFRPGSLNAAELVALKEKGVTLIAWLADDPVLYGSVYRSVVDLYDLVLHTGNITTLSLYDSYQHRPGVIFPFWADEDLFKPIYQSSSAQVNYVFMGNVSGPIKRRRYDMLAELSPSIKACGGCDDDPLGFFVPAVNEVSRLGNFLSQGRIAINIPQFFSDYEQMHFLRKKSDAMDWFEIPSRVVQYAAFGLPIISLGCERRSAHFPLVDFAKNGCELMEKTVSILKNDEELMAVSLATRKYFEDYFSSISRARYLLKLIRSKDQVKAWSMQSREFGYMANNV